MSLPTADCRSMGGWSVLYYLLKYPPTTLEVDVATEATQPDAPLPAHGDGYKDGERARQDEKDRVQIAGAFVMCPMVEGRSNTFQSLLTLASAQSRPSALTEYIGRGLKFIAGSLPIASAVRGNVSDDPRVEEDFYADRESMPGVVTDSQRFVITVYCA
jgi:acylglycerol lipase